MCFFPKAGAKVLLFFDMTKYFCKKMHFFCIIVKKIVILQCQTSIIHLIEYI